MTTPPRRYYGLPRDIEDWDKVYRCGLGILRKRAQLRFSVRDIHSHNHLGISTEKELEDVVLLEPWGSSLVRGNGRSEILCRLKIESSFCQHFHNPHLFLPIVTNRKGLL